MILSNIKNHVNDFSVVVNNDLIRLDEVVIWMQPVDWRSFVGEGAT